MTTIEDQQDNVFAETENEDMHPDLGRVNVLLASTIPFLGVIYAAIHFWGHGLDRLTLGLALGMFVCTGFGITIGYHRLFTHKSFETYSWVRYLFGIAGSMALEGTILIWVTNHRHHHTCSDREGDPHSPVFNRNGLWQRIFGFIHAHYGWMLKGTTGRPRPKDMLEDKVVRRVDRYFFLWVILGILIPAVLDGVFSRSWTGAARGFLWAGLVRIFLVHHTTWSINSICHVFGSRPFRTGDASRNNWLLGLLGFGEGHHNNHHAFPTSARHGLFWWQIDASWLFIKGLEKIGLAWNVRAPTQTQIALKLKSTA